MAIQMRRGLYANLDASKLVAGEIVVATDSDRDYIGVAKAPSQLVKLATQDDLDNAVAPTVTNGCMTFGSES